MGENPKVSILCTTYNQEKFIGQALDSFIAQKTNFDFEICVYDDASTDNTPNIIREYEKKYPDKFNVFYQKENQYSQGVRLLIAKFLFPMAKGDYLALCEGDDFFSDENKLQIQADFLDSNTDCSMCFHLTRWFFENNEEPDSIYPDIKKGTEFTIEKLLKENFMNTNAVMYRRQKYDNLPAKNIFPGDWFLHLYHAQFGKIGFINKVMSAYRRHAGGMWWNSYNNPDELIKKHGAAHLAMYFELLKLYSENRKYKEIIFDGMIELIRRIAEVDKNEGIISVKKVLSEYPTEIADFLLDEYRKEDNSHQVVKEKNDEIEKMKLDMEIMKSSKFWKLRDKYLKLKNIWSSLVKG